MARVMSRLMVALFFACLAAGVMGVSSDAEDRFLEHPQQQEDSSSSSSLGWVCDVQPPTQYCGSAGVALTTPLPYPSLSTCLPGGGGVGEEGSIVFIGDSVTRHALFDWLTEDVAGCATAELGGEGMDTCASLAAFGRKRGDYAVRVEAGGGAVSAWPLPNPAAVAAAVSGGATFTFLSATFFRNVTGAPWLAPTLAALAQAPPSSPSRLILSAGLWNIKYDETPTPTSPSLLKEEALELVAAIGAAGVPWDRVMWRGLSATDPLPSATATSQAVSQRYTPEAVAEARTWLSNLWAQAGAQILEVAHITACAPKGTAFPLCRAPPTAASLSTPSSSSLPLLPLAADSTAEGEDAAALVPSLPHKKDQGHSKKEASLTSSSSSHHHHSQHHKSKHTTPTLPHHVHSRLTVDGTHLPMGVSVGVMRATLHALCGAGGSGSSSSSGGVGVGGGRRLEGGAPAASPTTPPGAAPAPPPAAAAQPAKPPPLGGRLYTLCVISAFTCAAALLALRAHRPNLEALLKTTPGAAAAYVVVLSAVYLCDVGKVFPIVDKDKAAGRSFDSMLVYFILVTLVAVGTVAPTQAAPPAHRGAGAGSGGGPNKPVTPERAASPAPVGGGGSGSGSGSGGAGEGGALGAMESGAGVGGAGGSAASAAGAGAGATAAHNGGGGEGGNSSNSSSGGVSSSSEGAGLLSNMDGGHGSTASSGSSSSSSSSSTTASSSSSVPTQLTGAAGSVLSAASSAVGVLSAALGVSSAPATSAALRGSPENGGFFPLPQSLEWKGWMMAFFLLYHYWDVKPAYPAIRVAVGAYLFLTGYGNFMSLSKKGPSLHKLAMSVLRINLFTASVMAVTGRGWVLYYIAPLHTLWTVVVYVYFWLPHPPPLKLAAIAGVILALYEVPGVAEYLFAPLYPLLAYCGVMKEWVFRSRLDAYAPLSGMLFAYATPRLAAWLDADAEPGTPLEPASPSTLAAAPSAPGNASIPPVVLALAGYCGLLQPSSGALRWRVAGIGGGLALALAVHSRMYAMDRFEYNGVHRFTEWVPIFAFLTLRNLTPALRGIHLRLFAWLGEMSLELYILQFHVWMAGDAKKIVVLFPDFRGVSFLVATLGFVAMAWGASHATGLAMKRIEAAGETAVLGAAGALVAAMCIINALPSSCSAGGAGGR